LGSNVAVRGETAIVSAVTTVTVKLLAEVAVPPGVVTEILPVVAPVGTVAVIWVELLTAKEAVVPLNLTAVAPVRFVPAIVTVAPTAPVVGEKLVTVGTTDVATVKLLVDVAVPTGVVTEIFPVVAVPGTVAVIWPELRTNVAAIPLKATAVAPVRFVPEMETAVPVGPLVGAKFVIVGVDAVTMKSLVEFEVPPGVMIEILPVFAPFGTVAVI